MMRTPHGRRPRPWLLLAGLAFAPATLGAPPLYVSDGVVVFEAEEFSTNIPRGVRAWEWRTDVPGFSGTGFMVVTNNGADPNSNINVNVATTSPELQYAIVFPTTGTFYVWARGYGLSGTEDSIHVGLDGGLTPSSSNLTWATYGSWTWTNGTAGGAARSIAVGSTGVHTLSVWMREDGACVDRLAVVAGADFKPIIGNSWHIPFNIEADIGAPMRNPVAAIYSNTAVQIFNGNQFRGSGNPGNQLRIGSAVFYRHATNLTWIELPMAFFAQGTANTNNKYFYATIPAGSFRAGDVVQYYLRIPYSDHLPTYLYGNDSLGLETEFESVAQADPFSFTVQWPLLPSGPYVAITNATPQGDVEARVYTDSGHLSVVGPDLAGQPLANMVHFAPPAARVGSETHLIGEVLSVTALSNGLELVQRLAGTAVVSRLTFIAEGVARYEVTHWGGLPVEQTIVTAPSDASEHFFGLGEKFNSVDQAGRRVRILTWDPPGDKGDQSYKVAPWFLSTRGYGFHLDSSAESYFDLRAALSDRYIVSNLFPSLKFNILYGPRLPDVLSRYTGITGRPPPPPAWAFAPWISSDHWRNGGEIRYVITKLIERDIPGSVIVFDSPWEIAYNDFTWNMTQFGNGGTYESVFWPGFASLADMMTFIRTNGYKAVCWMTPFINRSSYNEGVPGANTGEASTYAYASNRGYFVRAGATNGPALVTTWWKGSGSPVDFTRPDAAAWWMWQLSNLVAQSGGVIGGFKTDDGETSNGPDVFIPTNAVYSDGRTAAEMRNAYCVLYHRTVWNVLGTGGVLFARAGFTGSQAYPGYWSGDNAPNFGQANGLQSVVVAGQSAGLSGYAIWGHDIGGYQVDNNPSYAITNLFMRWTQFGAFSPLFQMHRKVNGNFQYPWSYGTNALNHYRSYAKLHTSLFPYLYTYAHLAATSGLPILRHPVLHHQSDANVYGLNHTYYFGEHLLAAIATAENQTQRTVYLPEGKWYDFWTTRSYAGGQTITWTNADQTKLALFVREGAMIPMISTNVRTLCDAAYIGHTNLVTMDGALDFLVYPATHSSFTLYDGTAAQCTSHDTVVTFTLTSEARPMALRLIVGEPFSVERDGVRLPKFTNAAAYADAALGWRYDETANMVLVKFNHTGGETRLTLGPDTVGDGVPNSWRQFYFGDATTTNALSCATCDPDGDGHSNLEEFLAGTHPLDAGSLLRAKIEFMPGGGGTNQVRVSWLSQPGIPYTLGWRNDLAGAPGWSGVTSRFAGDGSRLNWSDTGDETGTPPLNSPTGRRFYRVEVP